MVQWLLMIALLWMRLIRWLMIGKQVVMWLEYQYRKIKRWQCDPMMLEDDHMMCVWRSSGSVSSSAWTMRSRAAAAVASNFLTLCRNATRSCIFWEEASASRNLGLVSRPNVVGVACVAWHLAFAAGQPWGGTGAGSVQVQAPAISFSPDQVSTCGDAAQQMEAAQWRCWEGMIAKVLEMALQFPSLVTSSECIMLLLPPPSWSIQFRAVSIHKMMLMIPLKIRVDLCNVLWRPSGRYFSSRRVAWRTHQMNSEFNLKDGLLCFSELAFMQSFCSRINVHMPLWPLTGPGLNGWGGVRWGVFAKNFKRLP